MIFEEFLNFWLCLSSFLLPKSIVYHLLLKFKKTMPKNGQLNSFQKPCENRILFDQLKRGFLGVGEVLRVEEPMAVKIITSLKYNS